MDGHHYSLLKRLREGDEGYWDKISGAVERGEIPRNIALSALEKCLHKRIPYYQHCIDTRTTVDPKNPGSGEGFGYWHGQLSEAVKTRRKIKDDMHGKNPHIIYKGKSI